VIRHNARPDEKARLMAAAAEAQKREILLREMQHRVKNNFSSFYPQSRSKSVGIRGWRFIAH
jgi:hypothetical protein